MHLKRIFVLLTICLVISIAISRQITKKEWNKFNRRWLRRDKKIKKKHVKGIAQTRTRRRSFNGLKSVKQVKRFYSVNTTVARTMMKEKSYCGFKDSKKHRKNGVAWKVVNSRNSEYLKHRKSRDITFEVETQKNYYTWGQTKKEKLFTERYQCRAIISAMQVWQAVADMRFVELPRRDGRKPCSKFISEICYQRMGDQKYAGEKPIMKIGFGQGRHQIMEPCNYPFDYEWGILAHAFYPGPNSIDGDLHFDYLEKWTKKKHSNKYSGPDLFLVAVHELGHAIGLRHVSYQGSIMYPTYAWTNWTRGFKLNEYDINTISSIYGSQPTKIRSCFAKAPKNFRAELNTAKKAEMNKKQNKSLPRRQKKTKMRQIKNSFLMPKNKIDTFEDDVSHFQYKKESKKLKKKKAIEEYEYWDVDNM